MTNQRGSVRVAMTRGLAALMATIVVFSTATTALGSPAEVFSSPAPVVGSDPPKAAELRAGEASVSTQTGALQYSYPISVPPGRAGMVPHLSLNYSSQAPLYGTIASGWSLSIPAILEDTSQGRLRTHSPLVAIAQGPVAAAADDRYISTMAGNRPLVPVVEPSSPEVAQTYRAQNDTSFTRYERMIGQTAPDPVFSWRAYTTSGTVMTFGEISRVGGCTSVVNRNYAPLTGEVDPFGNEIAYEYEWAADLGECRIKQITWGMNANAGVTAIAKVAFGWSASTITGTAFGPMFAGAQRSYRGGALRVTGASRLVTITATAIDPASAAIDHTRVITLGYEASAEQNTGTLTHAPYRQLKSIQESAWRTGQTAVVLPPVVFEYGEPATTGTQIQTASPPWLVTTPRGKSLAWGYRRPNDDRWATVEAMMIDIDGDGLLDRLMNASSSNCSAQWQRNKGPIAGTPTQLQFDPTLRTIALPQLKWGGVTAGASTASPSSARKEGCALNGQATAYFNSQPVSNLCHDGNPCVTSTDPERAGTKYCNLQPTPPNGPTGKQCPLDPGGGGGSGYLSYVAYRWLDADGDGLTDLVAAVHGDTDYYDIERGNLGAGTEPVPFGMPNWPACPGVELCKDLGNCLAERPTCPDGTLCPTDWTALNSCLTSTSAVGCFSITARMPAAVNLGPLQRSPYTRCEGLYPWFVFKNQGNGVFPLSPTVKYQPVPLESDQGDSGLTGTSIFAESHAVTDFDGDGWLDGIAHGEEITNGSWNAWYVWLGDGTGGMGPKRYFFPTRNHAGDSNRIAAADTLHLGQRMGTLDLNGDGLPDHWLDNGTTPGSTANIAFHNGTSFEIWGSSSGPRGEVNTPPGVKPSSILTLSPTTIDVTGTGVTTNRLFDVDNDGRIDIVKNIDAFNANVYFNLGGQFIDSGSLHPGGVAGATGALRKITASARAPADSSDETRVWELNADLMDLDGDGIAEPVTVDGSSFTRTPPTMTTPPRLLKAIDNGRGAKSKITYASMHDSTVVEQNPAVVGKPSLGGTGWFDGLQKSTSSTQWVVKNITVEDVFDTFAEGIGTTTAYLYRNPRQGPDDAGHSAFRGFETVETTAHSGAKTIQTYGYDIDWSGRLVKTVVKSAEQPTAAVSIDTTKFKAYSLFGGQVVTFHAIESEHFTCADSQAEASCLTAPPGYTKVISTITPKASDTFAGPDLLLLETRVRTQHAVAAADDDRQVDRTFVLASNGSMFRLRADLVTNSHQVSGAMVTYAKARTTWSTSAPDYARKLTDEVWVDGDDAHRSITTYTYSAITGNLDWVRNPRGFATSYSYDARQLFVSAEHTPAGRRYLEFDYEYGTGAKLETRGPNYALCNWTVPPDCTGQMARDATRVTVDGLGRTLERWETVNPDPSVNAFALRLVEKFSYVDTPLGTSTPTSVTHEAALKEVPGDILFTKEKTELDGHGRPIKSIAYALGAAPADSVTTYRYRLDGTLQDVTVPDPTANTSATVAYTYTFDSLGRALTMRRPQLAGDSAATGVNMSYNGLTKVVAEVAPAGTPGGSLASTRTTVDADGRLVKIEEGTVAPSSSPPYLATNYVTTSYLYFPDGGVKQITDPALKVTTMTRDLAGHRTSITRGGRTWRYSYDANGNLLTEVSPCNGTPVCDFAYTNTFTYDVLDRPYQKWIGRRDLTDADLNAFGAWQEEQVWDLGSNNKNRVAQAFSTGISGAEVLRSSYARDPQGRVLTSSQSANLPSFSATRATQYTYLLGGRPDTVSYNDVGNGATAFTKSKISYDARGLPTTLSISTNSGSTWQDTIENRNVAGLVTSRKTTISGLPYVESVWTYDKLGRVTDQKVNKGTTQVARQQLAYFGNDDPKTLTTSFGTTAKPVQTFGYDFQHQLKTITGNANYFGATYAYNAAGRFSSAQETQTTPPPGTDVRPRNVNYNYAGPDPEQVTSLTNVSGGATLESYTYDPSGNMLTRTEPSTGLSWTYLYDGENQLRRATKKQGATVLGSEEYWYDADGARTHVMKRDGTGAKTETIWFLDGTEAHYTATNTVSHVYSHISLGTTVARADRVNDSTISTEYQFHGLAGSTLAAIDKGGTVNATFHYAPFGEVIEAFDGGGASGTAGHKRRWNDKQQDDLTALTYYGARYYDKLLMGWTQADPLYLRVPDLAKLSTPRRSNLSIFSLNNPVRYIDPDGRDSGSSNLPSMTGFSVAPSEAFNADVASRQAGDGGYAKANCAHFSSMWCVMTDLWGASAGLGHGGGAGTTVENACDGLHGVCGVVRDLIRGKLGVDLGPNAVEDFVTNWLLGKVVGTQAAGLLDSSSLDCATLDCRDREIYGGDIAPPPPSVGPRGPLGGTSNLIPAIQGKPQLALSSPQQKAIDILRPGGRLIGTAGTNKTIRMVTGGQEAALDMFKKLVRTTGATVSHKEGLDGFAQLAGGGTLKYRAFSTFGAGLPTIDVTVPGLSIREIKFGP